MNNYLKKEFPLPIFPVPPPEPKEKREEVAGFCAWELLDELKLKPPLELLEEPKLKKIMN